MHEELITRLLTALVESWEEQLSPQEVGSDPEKIALFRDAVEAINSSGASVPPPVEEWVKAVFLRDSASL